MFALLFCHLAFAEPAAADKPAADGPKKEEAGEKKKDAASVKVAGIVFAHYEYRLTEGADGYNEFALDRAYVQAIGTLSPHWGTKVTLDANRFSSVTIPVASAGTTGAVTTTDTSVTIDTRYRVFVKHAYLEWKDDDLGLKSRFGIIDTPLSPYYDSFMGIRYITESMPKQFGLVDTADIGASLMGTHAKGLVDWQATVINGEGYSKLEIDQGKTLQGRLTIDPLAPGKDMKLPITAFVSYAGEPTVGAPLLTYVGAVGFQQKYLNAWAEVDGTSWDGNSGFGYSASVVPHIPDYLNVIFRYDSWDPSSDVDGDGTSRIVGGLSHDFLPKVSVAGTFEQTAYQADGSVPSQGVFLRMQAGY